MINEISFPKSGLLICLAETNQRNDRKALGVGSYIFSSLAKSMLNRFLPVFPLNCTSTNSVFCSISLLRMTPSPNLSCRTLSPGLYCCSFGLSGCGAGGGGKFFPEGADGGTVGDEYEPVRGAQLGGMMRPGFAALFPPKVLLLPLPNVRPVSRE